MFFGDDVAKTFKQSLEKFVKIQEDALLLFSFKTRAKELPNLKATVKLINAKVENRRSNNYKLHNPEYHLMAPILLLYKPELADKTQKLFDSIPITTDIIISEFVKHGVTYSSSNAINEKALSFEILAHNQTINSSQNIYHANTICEVSTSKKKIPNSLISLFLEFFIKNESDINTLILFLQQKFQILQEKLEQWRFKIAFEMQNN
ncbi:10905_t:CDS:2 [Cetraspora pellucida]|uniref:10905_t:CDS:1 n=1 Tax=Cetraspora pellucida TaxID=1433469 RepID=A0ACA9PR30_9GLOM|nr:10905_t:CDS:2 [Cetraspora pellucida]